MKKRNTVKADENEDMLPEYDLRKMRIVKRGPGHKHNHPERLVRVTLDPDIAEVFDSDQAVNEALRAFLQLIAAAEGLRLRLPAQA
jgi:hypothetical protein